MRSPQLNCDEVVAAAAAALTAVGHYCAFVLPSPSFFAVPNASRESTRQLPRDTKISEGHQTIGNKLDYFVARPTASVTTHECCAPEKAVA